jgi:hypothetical protein
MPFMDKDGSILRHEAERGIQSGLQHLPSVELLYVTPAANKKNNANLIL